MGGSFSFWFPRVRHLFDLVVRQAAELKVNNFVDKYEIKASNVLEAP